jgi:hypothetical protein
MNSSGDAGKASIADAKRIARLAMTQGGHYLDDLWALVEYAANDCVRAFAYAQATQCSKG